MRYGFRFLVFGLSAPLIVGLGQQIRLFRLFGFFLLFRHQDNLDVLCLRFIRGAFLGYEADTQNDDQVQRGGQ